MGTIATGVKLDEAALRELEKAFRGQLVRPGDSTYDDHRKIWNGSIDRHPALIARCAGVADVIAAVKFGRRTGLEVAVRGGGHSFPGQSAIDGGLVIDLSPMKGIRVDPEAARRGLRPACSSASWTERPKRSGWRSPPGSSRTRGWRGSRSAAASAG